MTGLDVGFETFEDEDFLLKCNVTCVHIFTLFLVFKQKCMGDEMS